MNYKHHERFFVSLIIALFLLLGATLNHFGAWPFSVEYSESEAAGRTRVRVELIGSPEVVFDYSSKHCDLWDIPDLATRAFRDAQGRVHLTRSHYTGNRSMVGASLDTVQNSCTINMASPNDKVFDHFKYHEWIASPYTLDGTNVYALTHNEWYGWLVDSRCTQSQQVHGWVNAIDFAVSRDGGNTYSHPADYLVNYPTTPWNNAFGCTSSNRTQYGSFTPSNIIKHSDGYYYAFFWSLGPQYVTRGSCLMRTANVANASSWEVYTEQGFTKSKTATCKPVVSLNMNLDSLTYNTYLEQYVLVGLNYSRQEISFITSKDLFNWSMPQKIIDAPLSSDGLWSRAYPSLLDPGSTSRNFETADQEAYVYYEQYNGGPDRDLMRQKVQFAVQTRGRNQ